MRTKLLLLTVTAALLFGAFASVSAQAPLTFLYQGRLTDANNQPITAATSVTFAVVSGPSGIVISLYDTVATVTPNDNGVFTIELGPMPESAFTGGKRYLAVTVGGTELLPRQPITSVPYAMSSGDAPGIVYSFKAPADTLTATKQVIDSVVIETPVDGWVAVQATGLLITSHTLTRAQMIRVCVDTLRDTVRLDAIAYYLVNSGWATDAYASSFAIQTVYSFAAGSHVIYLNGDESYGNPTAWVLRTHLTATFYPTAYGSVRFTAPQDVEGPQQLNIAPGGLPINVTQPGR
jgi:hypothetical protein